MSEPWLSISYVRQGQYPPQVPDEREGITEMNYMKGPGT